MIPFARFVWPTLGIITGCVAIRFGFKIAGLFVVQLTGNAPMAAILTYRFHIYFFIRRYFSDVSFATNCCTDISLYPLANGLILYPLFVAIFGQMVCEHVRMLYFTPCFFLLISYKFGSKLYPLMRGKSNSPYPCCSRSQITFPNNCGS